MHAFSVAPFDQNLSIEGKSLTDDSATLGNLGVVPESIICLKVCFSSGSLYSILFNYTTLILISKLYIFQNNFLTIFLQADEPIADYAAMDDAYQGE